MLISMRCRAIDGREAPPELNDSPVMCGADEKGIKSLQ